MKHLLYSALAIILLGASVPMTTKAGNPDSTITKKTRFTPRNHGWYATINVEPVAVNVNQKAWAAPMSLLSVSTGYQICPYIAIGGGAGFRWRGYNVYYEPPYNPEDVYDIKWNAPVIPVFLDLCINLKNKRITPYIPINIGYNFLVKKSYDDFGLLGVRDLQIKNIKTAVFFSTGIGMKMHLGKVVTWNSAVTVTAEKFKYNLTYYDYYVDAPKRIRMHPSYLLFAISTGFTF